MEWLRYTAIITQLSHAYGKQAAKQLIELEGKLRRAQEPTRCRIEDDISPRDITAVGEG